MMLSDAMPIEADFLQKTHTNETQVKLYWVSTNRKWSKLLSVPLLTLTTKQKNLATLIYFFKRFAVD